MANISQIEVNGANYDICDATARDSISSINSTIGHAAKISGTEADLTLSTSMKVIDLNHFVQTTNSESIFNQQQHGIRISQKGWYLISAQIYIGSAYTQYDIIHMQLNNTITNTNEPGLAHSQIRLCNAAAWTTLALPAFLYHLDSTPCDFWIMAKNQNGARGVIPSNTSNSDHLNYLTIVKLK